MTAVVQRHQVEFVGRKLRELRKERKLSQAELSSRIGIQQSDLSRMEKGEYRVSLDTLLRLLSEFEVSVGEFFGEAARESLTPADLRLVDRFKALPVAAQREIEELIAQRSRTWGGASRVADYGS
jgi:transcriptional regulator with XRE-family HTH domain